jgi:ABC transporter substrate binding protein
MASYKRASVLFSQDIVQNPHSTAGQVVRENDSKIKITERSRRFWLREFTGIALHMKKLLSCSIGIIFGLCLSLISTNSMAQWWNPFAPSDYEECADSAAREAKTSIALNILLESCPVGSGFIKSLAHPGGNITGMANMFGDAIGKSVELLHAMLPSAKRIAVRKDVEPCRRPGDGSHARRFGTGRMKHENCDALFVLADPTRASIVPLAAKTKIRPFINSAILLSSAD